MGKYPRFTHGLTRIVHYSPFGTDLGQLDLTDNGRFLHGLSRISGWPGWTHGWWIPGTGGVGAMYPPVPSGGVQVPVPVVHHRPGMAGWGTGDPPSVHNVAVTSSPR